MRLVAVSIVKNEADIIEPFVRHSLAWVDHHLIFDHDSTDGTRQILGALKDEGLPVTLFRDDAIGHLQQARSNCLTTLAAQDHGADWVLPLDADEILTGPDREMLERSLGALGGELPVSLPLLDYCPTTDDDASVINPVLRLRHCQSQPSHTRKIFIPRRLALDPKLAAGKGSHALYRDTEILPGRPLPAEFQLAHLALRSPQHQLLRVVRAELQRQSRGRAAAGLDVHYRLGYQLLAENPDLFFATVCGPAANLRLQPIKYRGGPLKHTVGQDWARVARALLPYLDQLATSHGRLADATGFDSAAPA
ncbi:MAG TPA: glycosyltransferase family 2 protein, partial [Lacunisphaera sp.]|nr:glycosyltransferase family 2 protein [Lacunisphaera sp.]